MSAAAYRKQLNDVEDATQVLIQRLAAVAKGDPVLTALWGQVLDMQSELYAYLHPTRTAEDYE